MTVKPSGWAAPNERAMVLAMRSLRLPRLSTQRTAASRWKRRFRFAFRLETSRSEERALLPLAKLVGLHDCSASSTGRSAGLPNAIDEVRMNRSSLLKSFSFLLLEPGEVRAGYRVP